MQHHDAVRSFDSVSSQVQVYFFNSRIK